MFNITWDKKAREQIKKLDILLAKRIVKKIRLLSVNPFSRNVRRLKNTTDYKLRVGNYRILFEVEENKIKILRLGHRKNIYKIK
ncbi:type II toxin-antitoxin system RelE/ParE family toxin [Candidatus Pacearchaeota archaeon]|nr:type II toxin-antitoxin system RelE/ParE family toxin [Candidatus Pacearchaeota archaeon]